jgi:enamine deaminase RidA (YjgF/YER057c/UK114 family)
MTASAEAKLAELGLTLPTPAAPIASYLPFVQSGTLLTVSGQLCFAPDGTLAHKGKAAEFDLASAQEAARFAALNLLAQVKAATGDLDRVARVVRLGGFINTGPAFPDLAKVMNGASDLMLAVFGERGRHARATVGVAELPLGALIEVEGLFEVV